MKKTNEKKGITLIALIITIIVLLILAGVSISLVVGDNGVLTQSKEAGTKTAKESFLEEANLAYADKYSDEMGKENFSYEVTLADIQTIMGSDRIVDVTETGATHSITGYKVGATTYELTDITQTAPLKIPAGGTKTLEVLTSTSNGEGTKYYAVVQNSYYEMVIENGRIKFLNEAPKTRAEIEDNDDTATLSVTQTTGNNVNIGTPAGKTVELTGTETSGAGVLTISYGNATPQELAVKVVGSHTVTLYANRTNATQSTPVAYKTITVDDEASVFDSADYAEPTGDDDFACWKTVTASESTDVDATALLRSVTEDISVYATYGVLEPTFGAVDTDLKPFFGSDVNTKNETSAEVNPTGGSDAWQLLYADANNLYLIYKDYYPSSAITAPTGIEKVANRSYAVKSTANRKTLINYLNKKSNWQTVASAFNTKFGVTGITATGAPTVDLFVASWNNNTNPSMPSKQAKPEGWTGYVQLFTPVMANAQTDGLKGHYIGTSSTTTDTYKDTNSLSNTAYPGYTGSANMYFPHPSQSTPVDTDCYGYWLASPSAYSPYNVMYVNYYGNVNYYNYGDTNYCARPVVYIPRSEVNISVSETDGTTLFLNKVKN